MAKRDLKADQEICNKATPGPWLKAEEPEVILENTFSQPVIFSAVVFDSDLGASKTEAVQENDLEFIAEAREGWPHAIERAIRAENSIEVYEDALKFKDEQIKNREALVRELMKAHPLEKWHEDMGPCLWWSFPVIEEPYVGGPLDCDFPDYVTHFTRLPDPTLAKVKEVLGDGTC